MKKVLFSIICAVCLGAFFSCSGEKLEAADEIQNPKYESLNKQTDTYLKSVGFTGAVLVAKGNKVLFAKGYGLTDSKNSESAPVSINSKFEIGSITKQFTAAAIMQLEKKKKLSLEDKISKYFPEYKDGDKITIKNLLTMRSGIDENIYFSVELMVEGQEILDNGKNLDDAFWIKFLNEKPLKNEPGKVMVYNNINYVLLGKIVEKVSGVPFAQYVQEHFFNPCNMTNTNVVSGNIDVKAYDFRGNETFFPDEYSLGAGGINSSVVDLFKWMQKFANGKIVSRKTLLEMTYNRAKDCPGYGYGLRYNGSTIFHDGETLNYNSTIMYDVQTKTTIIVLCNRSRAEKNANSFGQAIKAFWK